MADDGSNGTDLDPTNNLATEETPVLPPDGGSPGMVALKVDRLLEPGSYDLDDALVIEYTVLLENHGDEAALDLVYFPELDPHTRYIQDSASAPGGQVLQVDEPPFLRVHYDAITPGEETSIIFAVALDPADASALDFVECQGKVSGSNFPQLVTDDPDTPEPFDPTRTDLDEPEPPVDIPTLSPIGAIALSSLLILAVFRRYLGGRRVSNPHLSQALDSSCARHAQQGLSRRQSAL